MFRLWGKLFKDNHMLKDKVVELPLIDTRTHKVHAALRDICYEFDLEIPIWSPSNINEFKRHAKTRFYSDCFIEAIDFDYLEIDIIEED